MLILTFSTGLIIILGLGIHIAVALGLIADILLLTNSSMPLKVIAQNAMRSVNSYPLAAIPFFILAGEAVMVGRLAEPLIRLANLLLRRIYGGLAVATMITSTFFGAVTGSSVASCAALGKVTTELMSKENYPKRMIAGLTAVGGTLGLMIPPSLSFILIGTMVGIPIVTLFTAGIGPGLFEGGVLCIVTYLLCRKNSWGIRSNAPIKMSEVRTEFVQSLGVLFFPVLVLGGIYGGIFTPTEAAAAASVYSLLLISLVYRTSDIKGIWGVLRRSLVQSGMIYFIVIGGNLLGFIMTTLGISQNIVDFASSIGIGKYAFLFMVNIILLFLGCFLDGISLIILTTPILFPVAAAMGVDPIHFAVIITANIEVATLTPPVGLNLYVMSGISGLPVHEIVKGIGPFYAVRICMLFVITYVPIMSLYLVQLFDMV
jgi:C4-dicarboxylate transporter DctM subunit